MKKQEEPHKGFLISCDKNREKQAVRDAYNFLQEYIQKIYTDVTEETIRKVIKQEGKEMTLQTEVQYQKKPQYRLLSQLDTNVNCILFIKINPNYKQIDPLVVVNHMMDDVHNHGRVFTRYCHRILPVERAFRAEHFRMLDELDELLTIHSQGEIRSWMLNFKCRNNNKFNYKEVLKEVENLAKKHKHFPDIYYPQWAISIEITNHLMCLSICQKFKQTNEYKLHKNPIPREPRETGTKQGSVKKGNDKRPQKEKREQVAAKDEKHEQLQQKIQGRERRESNDEKEKEVRPSLLAKQQLERDEEDADLL